MTFPPFVEGMKCRLHPCSAADFFWNLACRVSSLRCALSLSSRHVQLETRLAQHPLAHRQAVNLPLTISLHKISRQDSRYSASTRLGTSNSGPTRPGCTRSFRNRSAPRPRCPSGSRSTPTPFLPDVAAAIKAGKVDLNDPATTVTLLKLNAVVGLKGTVTTVNGKDTLMRVGITCALCHSTVDNSFAKGIGRRMDGWPNRDLNVGAIIALSPAITPAQKPSITPGVPASTTRATTSTARSTPLVLPPAYGLAAVKNEMYTAEGPISYWNAYVAVTQMHGHGNFSDPRLGIDVRQTPDMVGPKLPALRAYQHSLDAPAPPAGSFDAAAAARGLVVFNQSCATCHVGGNGTDNNSGVLHAASETGMSEAYALRTANKKYRTTPLRGLWQHPPYFHDGSAASLADVVTHYNNVRQLKLSRCTAAGSRPVPEIVVIRGRVSQLVKAQ